MRSNQYEQLVNSITWDENFSLHWSGKHGYGISFRNMSVEEINPILQKIDDLTLRQRNHWDEFGWKKTLEKAIAHYERKIK